MGLITYQGIVSRGQIRLLEEPTTLPEGARVVVVVQSPISPKEWVQAFEEFEAVAAAHPPIEALTEEIAQTLIDETRAARRT
jgi:hypothetical protein